MQSEKMKEIIKANEPTAKKKEEDDDVARTEDESEATRNAEAKRLEKKRKRRVDAVGNQKIRRLRLAKKEQTKKEKARVADLPLKMVGGVKS